MRISVAAYFLPASIAGALLTVGSVAAQSPVPGHALRFDGVYRSGPDADSAGGEYCAYLRFYPKGGVVGVSSECTEDTPKRMRNWLTWTNARKPGSGLQTASYKFQEGTIAFVTRSEYGKVSYRGVVAGDSLKLDSRSSINGHVDSDTYAFVDWSR